MTDGSAQPAGTVRFDVLLVRDADTGASPGPTRPSGEAIEQCRKWFAAQGATCHPTTFGLACSMPRASAEQLFGAGLDPGATLTAPAEITELVDQITVPAEPELF